MPELAPKGRYVADPSHTSVLFRIKHRALSWYTGRFTGVSATLDYDPDQPEAMRLHARVGLRSVRMEYQGTDKDWDKELSESDKFLDALRHPVAEFRSERIERTGEDSAHVHGTMTFRGATHPFTFDVTYNGALLTDMQGNPATPNIGFSARGVLKRSDYGLTFGLGPRMPDEVQIIVETEMALAQGEASGR